MKRIYIVTRHNHTWLVKAYSQADALRIISTRHYHVKVATTLELVDLMKAGKRVIENEKGENNEQ